jgi:hypothetical protein
LLSAVVGTHNLLDGAKSALTVRRLVRSGRALGLSVAGTEQVLAASVPTAAKLGVLRHNVFAHLSPSQSYDDVFDAARITPDEIQAGCDSALEAVNLLLVQRGYEPERASELAEESYHAMLGTLRVAGPS